MVDRSSRFFETRQRWNSATLFVHLLVFAWFAFPSTSAHGVSPYDLADLKALQGAFTKLAEDVHPSVVAIITYKEPPAADADRAVFREPLSHGSGFVIDESGFLATNRHVVAGAGSIQVALFNGDKFAAEVVQVDRRNDLAVLKIGVTGLKPVPWADLDKVKVNQWAFAVGNPFGAANRDGRTSVTYGVVSALGRQLNDRLGPAAMESYYGNLIETSCAINPGSSGGPLFNIDGEVIGVVTAIETKSGVNEGHGFAIPTDRNMRKVIDVLKNGELFRYGFLGVQVDDVPPPAMRWVVETRQYRGARIQEISFREGPAAKSGLQPKDIIMEFDGVPVENADHLVRMVSFTPVGASVNVNFLRDNIRRTTTVVIGDRAELENRAP